MTRIEFLVALRQRISSFLCEDSRFAILDFRRDIERLYSGLPAAHEIDCFIAMNGARGLAAVCHDKEKLITCATGLEKWIVSRCKIE